MATLTYSEGCCCLFRILCSIIIMSAQTFYSTYELALHQSACYLLATRVKKEQQTILHCQKAAIREPIYSMVNYSTIYLQCTTIYGEPTSCTIIIVRMRTRPTCKIQFLLFVRSTRSHHLVILVSLILVVSHNAYVYIQNSFLWNN